MKKLTLVIILLFAINLQAQEFTGKATYKTHRKVELKQDSTRNSSMNDDMRKSIQEQLRRQFQRTYFLNFNKDESTWKQEEQLSTPMPQSNSGVVIKVEGMGGGTDVLYKNIKENNYANKTEISGKRFLIQDKLRDYGWEMSGETKNIGKYTCYKATFSEEVTRRSLTSSSEDDEAKLEEKKETIVTTAWYTPEIPVSNGPENYAGLPGLILEINRGKRTIVCTEIVLNPKEKIEIKRPKKGKKVTQKEFDEIMEERQKDMMERFRNNRRNRDGNSFSIQIGG